MKKINERERLRSMDIFAFVEDKLFNPVYNALLSGDARLSQGTAMVKFFDEQASPFAAFPTGYKKGFGELYDLLPAGRAIIYASPDEIGEPKGWQLKVAMKGLQFVYAGKNNIDEDEVKLVPLSTEHVAEMVQLATLTKPGPFNTRTIEFGHYHGIFENDRLAAMTGQRLHVDDHTEISAVCTHPDFLGKGYAAALMRHQAKFILSQNQIPYLHVRADNGRAIALYERLGFKENRVMNFYFMKRLA
jgi:ribosomal protein S18 acetylase RimI-like enzyme